MTTKENNRPPSSPQNLQPIYLMQPDNHSYDDEIDLRELWVAVWQGKMTIIAITCIFAVASVIFAIMQPNLYKSEALLAPAAESQGQGLSALAGQFGSLASLAGINLKNGSSDQTAIALEILKSRTFIKEFIQKHEILPTLMATKGWNQKNDQLIFDNKIYNSQTKTWLREVTPPKQAKPSDFEAYNAFSKILHVSQDKTSGLVTIGILFYSPSTAKQWVDWLIEDLNSYMRRQDYNEATLTLAYLNEQLKSTAIAGMQNIFYQLIEEQTKTIMLSKVRQDYILKTIDQAISPEEKAKPKRALICVLGTLLGGMLSITIVLTRHFCRKH
ncbi:Wzz/FepE/Etk N-terminal domain-containing protein [Dasania sp. GY-MA-18]|uniref:Wzz/FepE/Etk N-terminal domain-containing protein n=1 Tax=Dasania phycosphaerae TaxID=2950436 RepID=A0A9J6RNR4_9GAMM|nr:MULTISPECIES: Wzz/FepE/Etk N-terminal domain-containing protein [Dasania]MCR8923745.1 Wzz/FepE/Etk N-terminal domain-containing protein [Dasania sp. GY-MA-18]MCZ0866179.1 Wzz/FepE/Etk N-terminal domain-containing protein [Dasania phycosphaerae]MCZ0869903.1 Wzz/FepE/Etk N-terminal domain-containing protein [Dasania phycosphaerae]